MDKSWRIPPPCQAGDRLKDIDTPALLVDLNAMEYNRKTLSKLIEPFPKVHVRPHFKAHKCPHIATLQMEDGAVGLCAQTLTEAEALVYAGGINDILVSNQIIGRSKLARLAKLAKHSTISVCVDNESNIQDISTAASEAGVTLHCVVEVNVGQDRCGVEPGEPVLPLVKAIQSLPNISFKGIQCYQGLNQHVRAATERKEEVQRVVQKAQETIQVLAAAGVSCDYVTGGGTGTFPYEAASGVFTEVQPGSYLFMDVDYALNFGEDGKHIHDFQHSLILLATVQCVQGATRAVLDAGLKASSLDSGCPKLMDHKDLVYHNGGDEHGIIKPAGPLKVGDLVRLIPGHVDPTVNMHDWLIAIRGDVVEAMWPVVARGV